MVECFNNCMLQYHDKQLGSYFGEKHYKFQTDLSILDWNDHVNSRRATSTKHQLDQRNPRHQCYQKAGGQEVLFLGHSVAGLHRNLSPIRYVVRHFLDVFTYIPLTCVQLFIDKHRPFAQIETDVSAHAQIFTAEGIPSGTEALTHLVKAKQICHFLLIVPTHHQ